MNIFSSTYKANTVRMGNLANNNNNKQPQRNKEKRKKEANKKVGRHNPSRQLTRTYTPTPYLCVKYSVFGSALGRGVRRC